ncbi:enoyl-CoA hydratase/isomerase family protein [Roseobacter sp.]|uniref:enoyl-CoA hydratase/isomerase family protein n=1 Tax=Roseobacter sp. TaxID=1907202 RepID=UPI00329875ED
MPIKTNISQGHLSITLASPDTSNALSPDMVEALIDAFTDSRDVRSCTIHGEGRNFCAGFDLSDIDVLSDGDLLHRFLRIETMLQMVHHAPFPVMAMCHGHVVGAGADLVAACWKRVADPSAKFKMPGWNFELALGTRRLARLIGSETARDMLIDTRSVMANEAFNIGLTSATVTQENWAYEVKKQIERSRALPEFALSSMFDLTLPDTRDQDIAAIVATAGRPGLKDRIKTYAATVAKARKKKGD